MAAKKTSSGRGTASKSSGKPAASANKSAASAKKTSSAQRAADRSSGSLTTIDHDEIRRWAEDRNAQPACVKGTGGKNDVGMLRLDFPGYSEDKLQPIGWDEFFEKFDERGLALVYQNKTAGGRRSNFNKLVSREGMEKPKTRGAH